jgi:small conductance mechanosensitive channel
LPRYLSLGGRTVLGPALLVLDFDRDAAIDAALASAGRIVIVLILAFIAVWLIQRLITPVLRVAIREQLTSEAEASRRIQTLSDVIYRTTVVVISILVILTILPEFGINAGPLIAGLGLVGIAVGFGAQHLVRDVINGLEILIENQYGRGDFVKLGSISGVVEDINLRRTVVRDDEGVVHFIAHGPVEVASNYTRGYSRINFTVGVANTADLDRVYETIETVGAQLAADSDYAPLIREAPRPAGVERLGEANLEVRVTGMTEPGAQWRVAGELRRRLKKALDEATDVDR